MWRGSERYQVLNEMMLTFCAGILRHSCPLTFERVCFCPCSRLETSCNIHTGVAVVCGRTRRPSSQLNGWRFSPNNYYSTGLRSCEGRGGLVVPERTVPPFLYAARTIYGIQGCASSQPRFGRDILPQTRMENA
jgi:hypothetical protein